LQFHHAPNKIRQEILLGLESTLSKNEQERVQLRRLKSALMSDLLAGGVRVPADLDLG